MVMKSTPRPSLQEEMARIAHSKTGYAYLDAMLGLWLQSLDVDHICIARLPDKGDLSIVVQQARHDPQQSMYAGPGLKADYLDALLSDDSYGCTAQPLNLVFNIDHAVSSGNYIATLVVSGHDRPLLLIFLASDKPFVIDEQDDILLREQSRRLLLEIENIELRKQLDEQQLELDFIRSTSRDLYWSMDASGRFTDLGDQSRMIYGYEPDDMRGKHYAEFMSETSAEHLRHHLQQAIKEKEACNIMATHTDRNNNPVHIISNIITRFDMHGQVTGFNGMTSDVTGAVNAERIIKNNSELFSSILSRLPVIFFRIDENGIIADIRGNGLERMGVNDMDWVGKPGYGLFLGMDQMIDSALSGEAVHFRSKGSYQGKPWWFYTSMFFDSWTGFGAVGFSVDITDQVAGEEKLAQLLQDNRILAQRLVEVQEDERRNLARELHDELGQSITAVKSLAKAITAATGDTYSEVRSLGNSIIDLSGRLYDVVNNIMQRLRPDVMDSSIGFAATIRSCVVRSQLEKTGINVDIKIHGNINDLDEVVKITIYRIIQEALTNISKYAMASNVQ
ncbi:MAG: PAS domain S-box protein, partial [Gammaproteobacteria bacterium]